MNVTTEHVCPSLSVVVPGKNFVPCRPKQSNPSVYTVMYATLSTCETLHRVSVEDVPSLLGSKAISGIAWPSKSSSIKS